MANVKENLRVLLSFVPTGTTEGERQILGEAFVQTDHFAEIITPPAASPRILVGKKGSGKSAIIDFSMKLLASAEVPAILLKPVDIDLGEVSESASSAQLIRAAHASILRSIAAGIGSQLSGFLTGEAATLYNEAIAAGQREPDVVGKLARLLSKLAAATGKLDLKSLLPNSSSEQRAVLEKSIEENIRQTRKAFFIFIDDTDQVGAPGHSGHLNRVWAVILAAREISSRFDVARVVVSLREEVWRALQTEGSSQRDQLDHFALLVYQLSPDLDYVQEIFERRLTLAAEKLGQSDGKPHYELFFEGERPLMPTSQKRSSWPDIIRTRSRERPRDAIQLINMLTKKAADSAPPSRVTDEILASVMPTYSEQRAKLLATEFERECPSLMEILKSFSKIHYDEGSFAASCETVRTHLRTLASSFSILLVGTALKPGNDDDVFKLWAFLYSIGFIYPRVSDSRKSDGYRFILPSEQATFVHKNRWNEMQKAIWEVHPSYRDYIIATQKDEAAQFGLPVKRPPRSRQ